MSEIDRLVNGCLLPGFAGGDVPPEWVHDALQNGLAGVVVYGTNLVDDGAIARIALSLRETAPDALVAIDEEGGDVTRLDYLHGSAYPGNLALGVVDDVELTYQVASSIAADLAANGVNYNLAPSVDVNSDPDNPVIGVRSFGADPSRVAAHGVAYIKGMQDAGIATAAKHFPGHGATVADSHHALPTIDVDLSTFRARELPPFVAAIQAGATSVMTSHVVFTALDPDEPATLSSRILHRLLRDELGYDGVLVTDALDMQGASGKYGIAGAAVRAFLAGADLLLLGSVDGEEHCARIRAGIAEAIDEGRLDVKTLEAAAARVDKLRAWAAPGAKATSRTVQDIGLFAARRAVQARGDVVLPSAATVVNLSAPANLAVGQAHWSLAEHLVLFDLLAGEFTVTEQGPTVEQLLSQTPTGPVVLVARDAYRRPWQRDWARSFLAARPDAVLVAIGMPDDEKLATGASVCTFGAGSVNLKAAAEILAGR
ncbi:MAG TPA: glycoside hydrolase family 3 N-terminal domain-containing protein [Acidothermaceae bacterium]|nr:glycoside hydrolase family 3 N-terminal domain-containing protein [Acidothermaceae bacterium]